MGFHSELNKLATTINYPLNNDSFKLFLADVHILYDKSWNKKSKKIPDIITNNNNTISIIQSNQRTNLPIKTFKSAEEASNSTKIAKNKILNVCNGAQKTAGGYKWSFYEDIK